MKEVSFWREGGGEKCKTIWRIVRTSEKILVTPLQGVSVEGGGELVSTLFIGQAKACMAEKKINF